MRRWRISAVAWGRCGIKAAKPRSRSLGPTTVRASSVQGEFFRKRRDPRVTLGVRPMGAQKHTPKWQ